MKLSPAQTSKFWPLFAEACRENLPLGCDKETKDAFRRKLIFDSTGESSLTKVLPGRQFERLMSATAALTDNWQERVYWCTAKERKFVHLIGICTVQIGQIANEPHAWQYVKGVLNQAHWPSSWEDISADMLSSVFQMLDTHRRRLLDRAGWMGSEWGQPLKFHPDRTYFYTAARKLEYTDHQSVIPVKPDARQV